MVNSDFQLKPPDRQRIWRELALTMSQAATLTGVSERQIQHWMDRGYIDHAKDGGRKVSGETLDCILLIKQARSAGVPLRRAVPMAREYLRQESAGALDTDIARQTANHLRARLLAARAELSAVEDLLDSVLTEDRRSA